MASPDSSRSSIATCCWSPPSSCSARSCRSSTRPSSTSRSTRSRVTSTRRCRRSSGSSPATRWRWRPSSRSPAGPPTASAPSASTCSRSASSWPARRCPALAWSAESLIAFRVLQGLGGGMLMPAGMTILTRAAGPQRVGRVMAIIGVPMLLGPILGPDPRRLARRRLLLALDLLHQPADRHRRADRVAAHPPARRRRSRRALRRRSAWRCSPPASR